MRWFPKGIFRKCPESSQVSNINTASPKASTVRSHTWVCNFWKAVFKCLVWRPWTVKGVHPHRGNSCFLPLHSPLNLLSAPHAETRRVGIFPPGSSPSPAGCPAIQLYLTPSTRRRRQTPQVRAQSYTRPSEALLKSRYLGSELCFRLTSSKRGPCNAPLRFCNSLERLTEFRRTVYSLLPVHHTGYKPTGRWKGQEGKAWGRVRSTHAPRAHHPPGTSSPWELSEPWTLRIFMEASLYGFG